MLLIIWQEGVLSELMHADILVLMRLKIKKIKNNSRKWKAIESNGSKVNLGKTKVMASGRITKDGFSKSIINPRGVNSLRIKANTTLCVQCGKWIHSGCAAAERQTTKHLEEFCLLELREGGKSSKAGRYSYIVK